MNDIKYLMEKPDTPYETEVDTSEHDEAYAHLLKKNRDKDSEKEVKSVKEPKKVYHRTTIVLSQEHYDFVLDYMGKKMLKTGKKSFMTDVIADAINALQEKEN